MLVTILSGFQSIVGYPVARREGAQAVSASQTFVPGRTTCDSARHPNLQLHRSVQLRRRRAGLSVRIGSSDEERMLHRQHHCGAPDPDVEHLGRSCCTRSNAAISLPVSCIVVARVHVALDVVVPAALHAQHPLQYPRPLTRMKLRNALMGPGPAHSPAA